MTHLKFMIKVACLYVGFATFVFLFCSLLACKKPLYLASSIPEHKEGIFRFDFQCVSQVDVIFVYKSVSPQDHVSTTCELY